MLKLLDRYLLSQYFKHFLTVNVAFASIYLLIDFIEKFDNFSHAGKSMGLALKFFMLNVPFVVDQLGPILILLSGVISLGILNHTHELTALKAGGIPLRDIVKPLLLGSVILTALLLAAAQWLLPATISRTTAIWYEEVKGKLPLGIYRNGRYYYKGKEGFYSFEWHVPEVFSFKNFSYSRWNDDYTVAELITSTHANWSEDRQEWILGRVQIHSAEVNDTYEIKNLPYWQHAFPESPEDFLILENQVTQLSLIDLYQEIGTKDSPGQRRKAWAEFLSRISYIFLGIPLLLLGLPILLISYQKWGRDLSVAIPVSCVLAFMAWGAWGALQSLAVAGHIPPLLAAFTIHILFSSAGIFLLGKQDK